MLLISVATAITLSGQETGKKIIITGQVLDIDRHPVANAELLINDRKTGKTTDKNGYYKIRIRPSVTKIGIVTDQTGVIEEPVNGRTMINFTLSVSVHDPVENRTNQINEEEISVGYGSVRKKYLTQPVSRSEIHDDKYSKYRTIYDLIRAEVPSVQVSGTSFKIQGATSISGSTEPLLVVDGVIQNSIDNVSPQMVKSVEVLKGSAASIYGSRGANGVILINLKGGKVNK